MTASTDVQLAMALAEIERLRARIAELDTIQQMLVGTFCAAMTGELADPPVEPIAQNYPPGPGSSLSFPIAPMTDSKRTTDG